MVTHLSGESAEPVDWPSPHPPAQPACLLLRHYLIPNNTLLDSPFSSLNQGSSVLYNRPKHLHPFWYCVDCVSTLVTRCLGGPNTCGESCKVSIWRLELTTSSRRPRCHCRLWTALRARESEGLWNLIPRFLYLWVTTHMGAMYST